MVIRVATTDELETAAHAFAATLTPQTEHATLVTLTGPLGAGKTAFVQALAQYFGIEETVVSPTFVIERIYAMPRGPFGKLVHIDAYRMQASDELAVLGWDNLLADVRNLICLEWPERVADRIPPYAQTLSFALDGDVRLISV